ncbi:acyl-CoA synthase [Nocardia nova]|uniref:Acyl-CoA synthase n=1 Tax=Nocardia nova TaxID=37330 RepID=A0A2S6A659_9NOCA|nr:acyl-CoA synthase [Nocardia nova]PPJ18233.1 acyl-CoA synthase [Nocardia nova]PPJ28000.1 acyl-CoA synthase [Nocardia nova]
MDSPHAPKQPQSREDEDDHDLLTYGEALARLSEESMRLRETIAQLERTADHSEELIAARHRLDELEQATQRNRRQPINDDNFEQFFGYRGTARRNT